MKTGIFFLLATAAVQAGEPGKTVWYDSTGKVALIEASPKRAPEPFVPLWVAREERRDRALKGGVRHHRNRTWSSSWGWGYPVYGFRYATPTYYRCVPSAGIRVIIR